MTTINLELIDTLAMQLQTLRQVGESPTPDDLQRVWDQTAQVILTLNDQIREALGGGGSDALMDAEDSLPFLEGPAGEKHRTLLEQFRDDLEVEMIQWVETTLRPRLYQLVQTLQMLPPANPGT